MRELSEATGRRIRFVPLAPGEFVAELTGPGWQAAEAEDCAEAVSPMRRGMGSHTSDGVWRALGRRPRDFTDYAKAAVRTWHD
ncbi:hypothetical protein [Streptomyces sp. NPDC016172]|uniref:hypothetical protein n=1 Tax=Streptomyces sp. NPDC016172 TaxID=3364964 RepID=UPI0036FD2679